jgi:excisionase family DNA binding protein
MALLTVEEAARVLRVKVSWLYERTRTNEVPHIKLGKYLRFDEDVLNAWTIQFRRDGRGSQSPLPHQPMFSGKPLSSPRRPVSKKPKGQ